MSAQWSVNNKSTPLFIYQVSIILYRKGGYEDFALQNNILLLVLHSRKSKIMDDDDDGEWWQIVSSDDEWCPVIVNYV
jgi:hypothetical protein